jgi:4-alpha-glucanotransferase
LQKREAADTSEPSKASKACRAGAVSQACKLSQTETEFQLIIQIVFQKQHDDMRFFLKSQGDKKQ